MESANAKKKLVHSSTSFTPSADADGPQFLQMAGRFLIILASRQTGDFMHVAGAMVCNKQIDVLILYEAKKNYKKDDADILFNTFLGAANGDISRVKQYVHEGSTRELYLGLKPEDPNGSKTFEVVQVEELKIWLGQSLVGHLFLSCQRFIDASCGPKPRSFGSVTASPFHRCVDNLSSL